MENRNRKTIYISNLTDTVTEDDLKSIFENFGSCVSCQLNKETQSAYFEFENEASALKALGLDSVDMGDKPVRIVIAYQEEEVVDEIPVEEVDYTKAVQIFVGDIGFDVDEAMLKDGFSQFGTIFDTKVVRMPDGKHRGFAFITFSNETEAENAIQSMNNTMFHNRNIKCNWATKNKNMNGNGLNRKSLNQQYTKTLEEISCETPYTNSSVYVTGENLTAENLRPCFERFGKIKNIKAYPEKNHAFINYDNHEAAAFAIFQLNNCNTTSFKCNWSKKNVGSTMVSDKQMLDNFYSSNQQYYDNSPNQYFNSNQMQQQYEQFYQANYQASQYQQQYFNNPQVLDYYNNVQMQKFPQHYQNNVNARPQKPMNHQTYPYYAAYNNNSQQFNMYQQ